MTDALLLQFDPQRAAEDALDSTGLSLQIDKPPARKGRFLLTSITEVPRSNGPLIEDPLRLQKNACSNRSTNMA